MWIAFDTWLSSRTARWCRAWLVCLLLAGFTGLSAAAEAPAADYPGKHTDKAFAALLSMPGAAPAYGVWDFPRPADFTPGDETALIRYLAVQLDAGADVNARRHLGTLLHHAIRAGLTATANWLLDHGADPLLGVDYEAPNALALARKYGRDVIATRLRDEFHVPEVAQSGMRAAVPVQPALPEQIALALAQGDERALQPARQVLQTAGYYEPPAATEASTRAASERARWNALEAQLTPEGLARVVDDEVTFGAYVRLLRRQPERQAQAWERLPDALLKRRASAAVALLAYLDPPGKTRPDTTAALHSLWQRIGTPIAYAVWPGLAGQLDPDLWEALFASGYANHDAESALGCALARMPVADMIAHWPRLVRLFPNVVDVAPRMVLSSFRLADSRRCFGEDIVAKLNFLTAQGLARPVTGLMLSGGGYRYAANPLILAMTPYIPHADSDAATTPRLVDAPAECHFELTDAWFDALKDQPVLHGIGPDGEDRVRFTAVQLLAIPGRDECAVLAIGHRMIVEEYVSGIVDGFEGVDGLAALPSCADPVDHNELWLETGGSIRRRRVEVGHDYSDTWLTRVRDTQTGRRYFLQAGEAGGRCTSGDRIPPIYEWHDSDEQPALRRVIDVDLDESLHADCSLEANDLSCRGIALLSPGVQADLMAGAATPSAANVYRMPVDIATFITAFRPVQHAAYLAAVMALDESALAAFDAQGMPVRWRADAFTAVLASDLSASQKRERMARLLRDDMHLDDTLSLIPFETLLDWLTLDDWSRLLRQLGSPLWMQPMGTFYLDRNIAAERGHTALACMIDNANGWMCGETIDVDERP